MSPNEFQLRAALHDGEGDPVSADRVIAGALRARRDRRRRITSIASGAVVVAVVGVGVTALARSGNSESAGGSDSAATRPFAQNGQIPRHEMSTGPRTSGIAGGAVQGPAASGHASAKQVMCPTRFPQLMLPGGGGTDQFGAGQPLFPEPVSSITVCGYSPSDARSGTRLVTGAAARDLAATLEHGAKSAASMDCASASSAGDLVFYPISSGGKQLRFVTAHLACPFRVTNGTAVRYVPLGQLNDFRPPLSGAATSPAPNEGSPLH